MKFSEIPLFAIEKFLKDLFYVETSTVSPYALKTAYFRGPRKGLYSSKYQKFYGYVKKDEGYKKLTLNVNSAQWETREIYDKDKIYIDVIDGDMSEYIQGTPSQIWSIVHNSGFTPTWLNITNLTEKTEVSNVEMTVNTITLTFSAETSGSVQYGYVNNEDELYFKFMYSIRSLPQPFSKWHALANSQ